MKGKHENAESINCPDCNAIVSVKEGRIVYHDRGFGYRHKPSKNRCSSSNKKVINSGN